MQSCINVSGLIRDQNEGNPGTPAIIQQHREDTAPRTVTHLMGRQGTEEVNEGLGVKESSDGDHRAQGSAELDQGVH